MKVMIITGSPNNNGLTAACGEQARLGAASAEAEATIVKLNDLKIGICHACSEGWGSCRERHVCQVEDDFQKLHESLQSYDAFILVTPVYWWDMSEAVKAFIDRLRRCEAFKKKDFSISGKPVICVAAAGGSGNGCISCLANLERFVDHLKGIKFDFIGVTRSNREYKLQTIYEASNRMAVHLKDSR